MNIIKFIRGTWWGADPQTLITLYKTFVRSIIDYGCFIYFPTQLNQINKLEKIQYLATRLALGFRNSTPTNILLSESKLPLLQERSKFLCNCYLNKVHSNVSLPVHKTIINIKQSIEKINNKHDFKNRILIQCLTNPTFPSSIIIPNKHYNMYVHKYNINLNDIQIDVEAGNKLKKSINPNLDIEQLIRAEKACALFTDGSKSTTSKSVGSACHCIQTKEQITRSLNKNVSIFTAECFALTLAMDIALKNPNQNYIVFSDAKSVLLSLKDNNTNISTNPYIFKMRNKIQEFSIKSKSNSKIKFFWIPGHISINGNEEADKLAKKASNKKALKHIKIPFTD